MSDLNDWDNTATGNSRTPVPDYMPEGQTPVPAVNDWGREVQAAVRRFFETIEWRNFLKDGETPTLQSATTLDVPAAYSGLYAIGQRVRITDASTTSTGSITDKTGQTLTILFDSPRDLVAPITLLEVGISPVGYPISVETIYNFVEEVNNVVDDPVTGKLDIINPTTKDNAIVQVGDGQIMDAGLPLAAVDVSDIGPISLVANTLATAAHTLAAVPSMYTAYFKWVGAPANGLQTNDTIPVGTTLDFDSGGESHLHLSVNDTEVRAECDAQYRLPTPDSGAVTVPGNADLELYFRFVNFTTVAVAP